MSGSGSGLESSYRIHGVSLAVIAEQSAVAEALEARLRAFDAPPSRNAQLRLEFLVTGEGEPRRVVPPSGQSRPVYDARWGEILYYPDADVLYSDFQGVRLRCEPGSGLARIECAWYTGRQLYLASHPLATISLMELFRRHRRFSLHAACLASGSRGVLLSGPSGAGKTTLAIALVRAGLSFLADDMVFLDPTSARVRALAFPDAGGVTGETVEHFSELAMLGQAPPAEGFPKRLVRMEETFKAQTQWSCEPVGLIFPEVSRDKPSRLSLLEPRDAWLRLVPDALLTHPRWTQAHLATLAALLDQVDCYRLGTGSELTRSVELIQSVL